MWGILGRQPEPESLFANTAKSQGLPLPPPIHPYPLHPSYLQFEIIYWALLVLEKRKQLIYKLFLKAIIAQEKSVNFTDHPPLICPTPMLDNIL